MRETAPIALVGYNGVVVPQLSNEYCSNFFEGFRHQTERSKIIK